MNTFAVKLWYDEGKKCTFYSVSYDLDDEEHSCEADKFFDCYSIERKAFATHAQAIARLVTTAIGEKYGAIDDFFDRVEDEAQALPPKPKRNIEEVAALGSHFPLRLYCLRISEQIVVLFNGGMKTAGTAQESELSMKFFEAKGFALRILQARSDDEIKISDDGRYLLNFEGGSEIILY